LSFGHIAAAENCNLAAVPLALFVIVVLMLLACEAVTERPALHPWWNRYSGALTGLAVALFLAAWMVNLYRYFQ
jgi:hypothetical protein